MKGLFAGLISIALPTNAFSHDYTSLIECKSDNASPILIELWKPSEVENLLHCVNGDFIVDMTPCAPDGGWGLSRGTGLADLSEVTSSWQEAHDHTSGKLSAWVGMTSIKFTANHGEGIVDANSFLWELTLDRVTGEAELKDSMREVRFYSCELVARKF